MDNKLWMNYGAVQDHDPELSALPFPWWPHDFKMREESLFGTPQMEGGIYSNPFYHTPDPFQDEFAALLNGGNGLWDDLIIDANMPKEEDTRIAQHNNTKGERSMINKQNHKRAREERVLTFEEVSQYFYMPIIQAAKELNVGLTLLKKKCRELGIPRWPHRKMKSMQTLIKNVPELPELRRKEGSVGDMQVKTTIEMLEQEQQLMEIRPLVKMQEKTKRLRQACFKANYKKRKLMALAGKESFIDSRL